MILFSPFPGGHQPRRDHPLGMLILPAPIEVPIRKDSKVTKVCVILRLTTIRKNILKDVMKKVLQVVPH